MSEEKAEYQAEEVAPDVFEWSLDSEDAATNQDLANWAMRKMYLLRQEIALVKAQHADMLTRLNSDLSSSEAFFLPHLEQWAAKEVEGAKRKSLILPYGTVQFRTVKAGVTVADKEAAIAWAQSACMDSAVRTVTTVSLDVEEYKRIARQRLWTLGEVVPGIITTEAHEAFSVRFGKEKEESPSG